LILGLADMSGKIADRIKLSFEKDQEFADDNEK